MLPPDFILPHGATPQSPMPEYIPEPGDTGIVVDADFYKWTPLPYAFRFCRPRIVMNGQEVPDTSWGTNFVPLAPGLYHVRVSTVPNWFIAWNFIPTGAPGQEIGFADAMIPVRHGHRTRTCYQASLSRIYAGALGPEPREHFPGRHLLLVAHGAFGLLLAVLVGMSLYKVLFG
ncbi:hypothetical protein [Nocardia sp. CA-290969]|uniref:hypothetical protein n=1 Tax=Nocardia sp. CA-290969 TaxID=3239986 RepID=UPI003D8A8C15